MADADVVLLVVDATVGISQEDHAVHGAGRAVDPVLVAWNKSDLVAGFEGDEVRGAE